MTNNKEFTSPDPESTTADERLNFSTFMADMKEQAGANSPMMSRRENFEGLCSSSEFKKYIILMQTRSRMIRIALLPVMALMGIVAVYLYFYPDPIWVQYLNGYVVSALLFLYILAAIIFAYNKANTVAFEKIRDMHLKDTQ